ncbi:Sensor protein ZraS [Vibrio aerogenes CECT 7868]|uniref:histidine kinase n=1 Tax=Vibrio aerogenes CECT 7868 TaxID=1216006 RepID=A0A1M5YX28_9VIBR|nr:ATP-binding protein [Vibrio aerogenes]SHI16515.1 Sensor protein ZraS [Vibrio aerogenes CECT 7868]
MSLKLKTILGVAIIEALLLGLLITVTLNYLKSTNYEGLYKRAITTATLFATTTKDAVLSYDLASLDALSAELMENPDLVYVRIKSPSGQIFAQAGNKTWLNDPFHEDQQIDHVSDGVFDTRAEIREAGTLYGIIELGIDTSSLSRQINEVWHWSLSIAIGEMGLVALFSYFLGSYLVSGLTRLRYAAYRISKGYMDVFVQSKGTDEIAEVSEAFNAMSERLKNVSQSREMYEKQLESLNKTLENQIEHRTRALEKTNEQLIHSEKMASIGTLAAGVAHEINNPVGFIMSNIRTLSTYTATYNEIISQLQQLDEQQSEEELRQAVRSLKAWLKQKDIEFILEDMAEIITDIHEGNERINHIVSGLKDFSHVDQDKSYKPANLNEAIEKTLRVTENELKYKAETVVELSDLPLVNCNTSQIQQVLLNLIINASHAIEAEGRIEIRSWAENNRVCISVRDNGSGIPPALHKKIFDPFFTTKKVGKGTGLGLAISYNIMKEHQGEILMESQPGEGTCFTLNFPKAVISSPNYSPKKS